MTDEHARCAVFRTDEDADAMRELVTWVRNGGMADLRELSVLASNLREARKTCMHVAVYAVAVGALGVFALGVRQWIVGMFRGGGQ